MIAILLAAGYATRLYPLTENFPKPLLKVGGRPILDWLVEDISPAVEAITVVSNHRFADHFREWSRRWEKVRVLDDGTETNEGRLGAVRDIRLASTGQDALVLAGDNVLEFSLLPFIAYAREKGAGCVMCHEERDLSRLMRTGVITTDDSGRITSYEEKPPQPRGTLAVPPFYFYTADDLARIPEALESGCGADAPGSFAAWLSRRSPLYAWRMPGRRYDIGDMDSYLAVKDTYSGPRM